MYHAYDFFEKAGYVTNRIAADKLIVQKWMWKGGLTAFLIRMRAAARKRQRAYSMANITNAVTIQ